MAAMKKCSERLIDITRMHIRKTDAVTFSIRKTIKYKKIVTQADMRRRSDTLRENRR